MCGICGFFTKDQVSIDNLRLMNDTMINRGPDDSGEEIFNFGDLGIIGMGHRRLSILDLSSAGHQPLHSVDDNIILVFNGEIYNFAVLRNQLYNYPFRGTSDSEVIIAAYLKWGDNFIDHIDGMFAIALYDKTRRQLILARDRIGKKPLYYYWDGNTLIFASTLKPILNYPGFIAEINRDVIPQYLFNKYIGGSNCILQGVSKLQPGHLLKFNGKDLETRQYWSLLSQYTYLSKKPIISYHEAKLALKESLAESVRRRMVADVPVGSFLSGGYDSSLVTAIAQSLSNNPIKTYSIGFNEKEFDESRYAKTIAKHLGTDHTSYIVGEEDMYDLVDSIPEWYDEPFADSSQIPSMLVAKIAKEDVTVVLTGDGGDEFFCGYRMYEKLYTAQRLELIAKPLRYIIPHLLYEKFPFAVKSILQNSDNRYKTQFGRDFYEECINHICDYNHSVIKYDESHITVSDWQIRRMLLDATTYLPDNNLCKVDRATMRYSLEARNPLLDINLIETSFKVKQSHKYYNKDKKHILKDLSYDYIPREMLERPKRGFECPISTWLRGPLREELRSVTSSSYLKQQGIFNPEYTTVFVNNFIANGDCGSFTGRNPSHIIWPLYVFQKWYQRYIQTI